MNRNLHTIIFVAVFLTLCLSVMSAVWYSIHVLREYKIEYETLEAERNNFDSIIQNLEERNRTLTEISELDINHIGTASDSVAFYSRVSMTVENSGMNLLSMSSGQNEKDLRLSLNLQGSYYSFARLIALWRVMPYASRIVSLRFRRDSQSPENFIDANLVIEGMNDE